MHAVLSVQLKDRDVLLRDLEGSKESEVTDARTKLQDVKTEYETRMGKEREENKVCVCMGGRVGR